ncbi:MAG: ABC transporter ATP-binding protein [Porticoccus sp.]|nr:ABC transporter ATP-binding protein [Porticoccus sp.]MBQ0807554.1 ABC transporter ATP-binding protein [Porticoccus sp.]
MIGVSIEEKSYEGSQQSAISNLNLIVNPGEFVAILGPSGSGKTTLLQLVSGLDRQFSGKIKLNAVDGRVPQVGYLFQDARLMPWLTVLDNVRLVTGGCSREPAKRVLQDVGLGDSLNSYPSQLSGGMQRRVALARALLHDPDVLLMDEPFVSLDGPNADRLRHLVLEWWQKKNSAVLFVTHSLDEAIVMADRLVFFSPGPASVILDIPVAIERPRAMGVQAVKVFKQQLLTRYPNLLEGRVLE